jgi:hypothetical protein
VVTYLLFDDAQDTYDDMFLWNNFFKPIESSNYRAILFCSYGNPTGRPVDYPKGTPPILRPQARISLFPTETACGLLLSQSEFDEVVQHFPLVLVPELQTLLFFWSAGHVGAAIELLHLISTQAIHVIFI